MTTPKTRQRCQACGCKSEWPLLHGRWCDYDCRHAWFHRQQIAEANRPKCLHCGAAVAKKVWRYCGPECREAARDTTPAPTPEEIAERAAVCRARRLSGDRPLMCDLPRHTGAAIREYAVMDDRGRVSFLPTG